MELSQTELFRPADDHGVCTWNVEAALHDIGRQENVCLGFDKGHHAIFNLVGRQSTVKTDDTEIRRRCLHPRQHRPQILNARTNQETLTATPLLAQQSRGDGRVR